MEIERKYFVLRAVSIFYYVMGILVLIFGSVAAFSGAVSSSSIMAYGMNGNGGTSSIGWLVGAGMEVGVLVVGFALIAGAQLVRLLLSVEENTRGAAESQTEQLNLMKSLVQQMKSAPR